MKQKSIYLKKLSILDALLFQIQDADEVKQNQFFGVAGKCFSMRLCVRIAVKPSHSSSFHLTNASLPIHSPPFSNHSLNLYARSPNPQR